VTAGLGADRSAVPVRYVLRAGRDVDGQLLAERLRPAEPLGEGAAQADFVLDLSDEPPSPALAAQGRHGLWFLRDEDGCPPGCLGEAAFLAGRRYVVVRLLAMAADGSVGVVEEGALRLLPFSAVAARRELLRWVADWPARHARALALGVGPPRQPAGARWSPPKPPGTWRLRAAAVRNVARLLAAEAVEEQWTIGVVDRPVDRLVRGLEPGAVRWLPEVPGGYLADPMVLPADGGPLTVVAEDFRFATGFSSIVATTVEWGALAPPREVLRLPEALSYPFLLEHGGQTYCLPEACDTERVQLYRADPFPDRWVPDRVLLEGFAGLDATLFRHEGRHWILATERDGERDTRLFAFHADDLFGPYHPHPLNPVRTDLRSSRPAGPAFLVDGVLHRPAQDSSRTYGGAVTINRIDRLSPTEFAETVVTRIAPDPDGPYPDGIHTVCGAGPVTIVDGKRHFRAPMRLFRTLGRMARKRLPRREG